MSSGVKTTKVTSYSSSSPAGGGSSRVSSSYSSSSGRAARPISQKKGRSSYSFGMGMGGGSGRMSYGGMGGGGGMQISRSVSYGLQSAGVNPEAMKTLAQTNVSQMMANRTVEKKDMQDLNERLASYIEKVRFLEAQNRKMASELKELREKWGKPSEEVKKIYEAELKQQRDLYDDSEKEKEKLRIQVDRLTETVEELNERYDEIERLLNEEREASKQKDTQLSDYEAELNLLRKRINSLEIERVEDKNDIERLNAELMKARCELDNKTLECIDAENRAQTLKEEIEFMQRIHDQDLTDLANLAYRDTTEENRSYWDQQLQTLLRELNEEYDRKMNTMRGQLEANYSLKMQEFSTGNARRDGEVTRLTEQNNMLNARNNDLTGQIRSLQLELENLKRQLQDLTGQLADKQREWDDKEANLTTENATLRALLEQMEIRIQELCDQKLSLEMEIAAYRCLVEGEEKRLMSMDISGGGGYGGGGMAGGLAGGLAAAFAASSSSSSSSKSSKVIQSGGQGSQTFASASLTLGGDAGGGGADTDLQQVMKGEMSAKTTFSRSAKGPLSLSEISRTGDYIELQNTSNDSQTFEGYSIKRYEENKTDQALVIKLPDTTLPAGKKIKFFAKGRMAKNAAKIDRELDFSQFSTMTANTIITQLLNAAGEVRAEHKQVTKFVG